MCSQKSKHQCMTLNPAGVLESAPAESGWNQFSLHKFGMGGSFLCTTCSVATLLLDTLLWHYCVFSWFCRLQNSDCSIVIEQPQCAMPIFPVLLIV